MVNFAPLAFTTIMGHKKILYLSYDGLTDPLGQSQIIPYLIYLAKEGNTIFIISAEKRERYLTGKETIENRLKQFDIHWHPIKYTKFPPIISTLWDLMRMRKNAKSLHKHISFDAIHCRSYITSLIGLWLKKRFGVKFIFDMRGFWADERVDGGVWKLSKPIYKTVFQYFKKKELDFLKQADSIISLTQAGATEISTHISPMTDPQKIVVIPCCADLSHFNRENVSPELQKKWIEKLNIPNDSFVLCYLGSIGTWYLLPEMVHFFKVLKYNFRRDAVFLFITLEDSSIILHEFSKQSLNPDDLRITSSSRHDLPSLLSLCHASVSFIKPTFSKKASSPTKLAELLGMGIPVFSNANVGDIDLYYETIPYLKINKLTESEYKQSWEGFFQRYPFNPQTFVSLSHLFFSLEVGAKKYVEIYRSL